jgi:2-dehydro-3-deoxyglucarate aldolase/4-hydroxy-2-oxoheptanedioate aldolase
MNAARLRERQPSTGTWISTGSPVVAELAALRGFDWLLLDLEHGCGTEAALLAQLQAIRGTKAAAIVRVGAPHPDLIARVLDWGADGIMVPHVSSAAEAEACVRAMRYPPRGTRGVSRSVRAFNYGLSAFEPAEPVFFAQIETVEAVERAADIARVDGVDVLFVGPADLRFDIQSRSEPARDYAACLREVAGAGKPCGILLRDPAEASELRTLGYTHIAFDTDIGILRAGYQRILQ